MRKRILPLVSVSLAGIIALSGCSSNDKLSNGKWEFETPDDLEDTIDASSMILDVSDQNFTLRSVDRYGDVNEDDTATGRVNRPKRALEAHNYNGSEAFTEAEKDNAGSENVVEYKFKGGTLIIRFLGEDWKGKKK
ncbi:hypothetical protein Q0N40_03650 [Corynebacterium pseudokroppenstedtii]|uniref:Secreted protein n=1 Tax=Corynebacterium pseudokroppenstedtii TaxID=2804917 RepID=A0AAU0Q372_9CORY|nr:MULTISPECIES: hypothetical protein [Corynebacterium]MBY0790860.1 hypothetical protein [Corynebacterium pseudokroppenstedtii]MCF6792673.1 hypothetical protein [Corynebacterium pseudokroppenstedtii]MCF8702614.1 hypothetical protein [Corynebacterium pseudokroppenstedtii]MCG2636130.1 hypothetical protein [Corynebacterium pseudokroppenstedtii]MDN8625138.1 hypothetical protein [Corynebacterium kroppenstedtii]